MMAKKKQEKASKKKATIVKVNRVKAKKVNVPKGQTEKLKKKSDPIEKVKTHPIQAKKVKAKPDKGSQKSTSTSTALAPSDPVAQYMAEIRKYPVLTKEQEREVALKYRETGDPRLAETLVTANLRFVVKVAMEYSRFGSKLIDLIQEGNVGLMHAVKEFNPHKGVRLISYAVWWIRGYIQEYLMRQYSLVRIGTTQNQRKLFYQLQKHREDLEKMGDESSVALLSGRLGVSEKEIQDMTLRMSGRDLSLDAPLSEHDRGATFLDLQEGNEDHSPVDELSRLEDLSRLKELLKELKPELNKREAFLLSHRLLSDTPMTLQEVGDKYGITREAVRQMEQRLIKKIRSKMESS